MTMENLQIIIKAMRILDAAKHKELNEMVELLSAMDFTLLNGDERDAVGRAWDLIEREQAILTPEAEL